MSNLLNVINGSANVVANGGIYDMVTSSRVNNIYVCDRCNTYIVSKEDYIVCDSDILCQHCQAELTVSDEIVYSTYTKGYHYADACQHIDMAYIDANNISLSRQEAIAMTYADETIGNYMAMVNRGVYVPKHLFRHINRQTILTHIHINEGGISFICDANNINRYYYTCDCCHSVTLCRDNSITYYGRNAIVCDDCYTHELGYCYTCNSYHHNDDMFDNDICNDCFDRAMAVNDSSSHSNDNNTAICCTCHNTLAKDDIKMRILHVNGKYYYKCADCASKLQDYHSKLDIRYVYGDNADKAIAVNENTNGYVFIGAEIELYASNTVNDVISSYIADNICYGDTHNLSDYLYIYKYDGSLDRQYGYELATQPMDLEAWQGSYMKSLYATIKHTSVNIQDAGYGIHLSVPADIFTHEMKLNIQRFTILNNDLVSHIAHRLPTTYCSINVNAQAALNDRLNTDHYGAVVFESQRIEFRSFISTIDYEQMLTYVEYVHALCNMVRCHIISASDKAAEMRAKFDTYIAENSNVYKHLITIINDTPADRLMNLLFN